MKLNKIEFLLMNNQIRNVIQEYIEIKRLRKFSNLLENNIVLEIGCGTGNSSKLIKRYFHPKKLYATDLDNRMIAIAKRRNSDPSLSFRVMDATRLTYKNNQFDAIVDFGVIHHISNWKDCLDELNRILKPGGQLILEDLSLETFATPIGRVMKKFLDHPYESMYTEEEFITYLKEKGFIVSIHRRYFFLVRYFLVIARKSNS